MSDTSDAKKITYTRRYGGYMFWSLYVLCALILLALGTWQVARHIEKKNAADTTEARLQAPPLSLKEALNEGETAFYKRVRFDAVFLPDNTIYLYTGPRAINGRPGYDVITSAFVPDTGVTIAVNRGWIDEPAYKKGGVPLPGAARQRVTIDAVLLPGEKQGTFTPDNDDDNNIWFWVDTDALAKRAGVAPLPVFATLETMPAALKADGAPLPREIKPRKHLPHMGYAVTWYSFFVILTFIVFMLRTEMLKKTPSV